MSVRIVCPHCNRKVTAPDSMVGKSAKCPGCGNSIHIENAVEAPVKDKNRKSYFLAGIAGSAVIVIAIILYVVLRPTPFFSTEELLAWKQHIKSLNSEAALLKIANPDAVNLAIAAGEKVGFVDNAEEVWREIEPILRDNSPSPPQIRKLRNLLENMGVIRQMVAKLEMYPTTKSPMGKKRAENDILREEDTLHLIRLEQLSGKVGLPADEITETQTLINALTARYGELGLSYNAAEGKIIGYQQARLKVDEMKKNNTRIDLENERDELDIDIRRLNKEKERQKALSPLLFKVDNMIKNIREWSDSMMTKQ